MVIILCTTAARAPKQNHVVQYCSRERQLFLMNASRWIIKPLLRINDAASTSRHRLRRVGVQVRGWRLQKSLATNSVDFELQRNANRYEISAQLGSSGSRVDQKTTMVALESNTSHKASARLT